MPLIRFSGPQQIKSVMDARSKFEWNLGHDPDAVHMPLGEINEKQVRNLGSFDSPQHSLDWTKPLGWAGVTPP